MWHKFCDTPKMLPTSDGGSGERIRAFSSHYAFNMHPVTDRPLLANLRLPFRTVLLRLEREGYFTPLIMIFQARKLRIRVESTSQNNKEFRYSCLVQSIFQISDVERPRPSFFSTHFLHTLCVRLDVERSALSLFIIRVHLPTASSKAQTHNAFLQVSHYHRYCNHRPLRFYHTLSTIPTMEASWERGSTTRVTACRSTSLIVCRSTSPICHPHYELI